jgi:hypothetical protein
MTIGWNFPSNDGGTIDGLNELGRQFFRENPVGSLTREVIQNSLDAHDGNTSRPVEVHFNLLVNQPIDRFPGRKEFIETLNACKKRWSSNQDYQKAFDKSHEILSANQIDILKISDYNTTGLSKDDGTWESLVKSSGVSSGKEGKGGSFGIGKKAVFLNSPIRASFYSSKDLLGNKIFQGVADLVTHTNSENLTTQGTGFYGIKKGNLPLTNDEEIESFFERKDSGTDIFVYGFKSDSWKKDIINAVLDNFFVAIHDNKLFVRVDNEVINSGSLKKNIDRYSDPSKSQCKNYYEALTSSEAFVKKIYFDGKELLDESSDESEFIELRILKGSSFPKRIAMLRRTGITIYEKKRFKTPFKFIGVFQAKGVKINNFLRLLENPQHDKWMFNMYENDPKFAEKILYNLTTRWIADSIKEASGDDSRDEYDVEGMQQFFPDDSDDDVVILDDENEEVSKPKPITITLRPPKKPPQETKGPAKPSGNDDDDEFSNEGKAGDGKNTGGDLGTKKGGGGEGDGGAIEDEVGILKTPSNKILTLKKTRAFCSNPGTGEYKIILESTRPIIGRISLVMVGETATESAQVVRANSGSNPLSINEKYEIGPIEFTPNVKNEITVYLKNHLHCAIEVVAYES